MMRRDRRMPRLPAILSCAAVAFTVTASAAHADSGHGHAAPIGTAAKSSLATRTVTIELRDIAFQPASVQVRAGETVRFVLRNTGQLLHEFNIGTPDMHVAHQKEMQVMMDHGMLQPTHVDHAMMKMDHAKMGMAPMTHDHPNSVLVEPGKTAELTWSFANPMRLEFACNVPGHYEAGMVGAVKFRK